MASGSSGSEGKDGGDGAGGGGGGDAKDTDASRQLVPYRIGGPGTRLPFAVESFLGWGLCVSCLAVSGYHYGKSVVLSSFSGWRLGVYRRSRALVRGLLGGWIPTQRPGQFNHQLPPMQAESIDSFESAFVPLTTHSRAELERKSPWDRYLSLVRLFERRYPEVLTPLVPVAGEVRDGRVLSNMDLYHLLKRDADAALVRVLRRDGICRRLASLAMRPYDPTKFASVAGHAATKAKCVTTLLRQFPHNKLLQRMAKYWKHFLALPTLEEAKSFYRVPDASVVPPPVAEARSGNHANDASYPYRISLVLPAFHEKGAHLLRKLTKALEMARDPNEVEVVVVDAGGCSGLELLLPLAGGGGGGGSDERGNRCWGRVSIFAFASGGGRGPCLNFGAAVATGRVLTFCHSDTTLPHHFDAQILSVLEHGERSRTRANSCAFSFGIDTSHEGLSMPFESSTVTYYPPGIKAVETTANMRTHLYSLPYGDQVISIYSCVFHFLGGYPDQCLMEDYELVSLLRRRAALFTPPEDAPGDARREKLAIIPGAPALCSPRRWQKFGVLYVTFMNSKFVNMYAGATQMSPDDLFRLYYGREPPKREASDSPWELELGEMMKD